MTEIQWKIDSIEMQCKQQNIYFHWGVLAKSLEGRDVEILTISSQDNISDEKENAPEDIYLQN